MPVTPQRILITGSSGYYGRGLVAAIRRTWPAAEILGLDVTDPVSDPPTRFVRCDITSPELIPLVTDFKPDTILHLAFVVNPMRDEQRMHQINVEGTRQLLSAAALVNPERLLISSSATVYGAWPDNPIPLTEKAPLRAREDFRYASDKVQVENLLTEFAEQHPEIVVSWTRPCIIYGPGMSNFMVPIFTFPPVLILPGGTNSTMQVVHMEDVVEATLRILQSAARGPFNIAPNDWLTMKDLARLRGTIALYWPYLACRIGTMCWWALRLPVFRFPATMWPFIRYPWVIAPDRLTSELGFQFRHSCRDVMRLMLREAGKLRER